MRLEGAPALSSVRGGDIAALWPPAMGTGPGIGTATSRTRQALIVSETRPSVACALGQAAAANGGARGHSADRGGG